MGSAAWEQGLLALVAAVTLMAVVIQVRLAVLQYYNGASGTAPRATTVFSAAAYLPTHPEKRHLVSNGAHLLNRTLDVCMRLCLWTPWHLQRNETDISSPVGHTELCL